MFGVEETTSDKGDFPQKRAAMVWTSGKQIVRENVDISLSDFQTTSTVT